MASYSDPTHALLERIAKALEANNQAQRKATAMAEAGKALIEHMREARDHGQWGEHLIKEFEDAKNTP